MKKIAVCLLSGGLDSCVASTLAKAEGWDLYLLSFNYGQVMQRELDQAKRISEILKPIEHKIVSLRDFKFMSRSSRTYEELIEYDREIDDLKTDTIPLAYPPGRDSSFIFLASAWVETLMLEGIDNISEGSVFIGTNKNDAMVFPDCQADLYPLLNQILKIGTKVSVEYSKNISVKTPLLNLEKDAVVQLGIKHNAPIHLSWSCYLGKETACGRCDPCKLRLWAFEKAGLEDPIRYSLTQSTSIK